MKTVTSLSRFPYSGSARVRATRGFAIPSAIFLLVVLAALGVAMVTFSTSQQTGSAYDVMGARAYQAARAGVEWALFQRLNPQGHYATSAYCNASASDNLTMPSGTSLAPFTVSVACVPVTNSNTATPITIRTITSIACNQPKAGACSAIPAGTAPGSGPDFIQRVVTVTIQK